MTAPSRSHLLRGAAGLLVLVGLAVLTWAGWSASPFYAPFDPRHPCLVDGLCDPAVVDEAQRTWWTRTAVAGVLVAVGVVVAVLSRPGRAAPEAGAPEVGRRPRSLARRAVAAGLVVGGLTALGALPLTLATLAAPQLGVAVAAWLVLSQTWVLDWWAASAGPLATRPRARLAGAAAVAGTAWLAGVAVAVLVGRDLLVGDEGVPVDGLVLALLALVVVDGLVAGLLAAALLALAGRGAQPTAYAGSVPSPRRDRDHDRDDRRDHGRDVDRGAGRGEAGTASRRRGAAGDQRSE
ncbi:hypothetical protein [Nocardioides perillae]|uniref:Uncharacterized protein n=1 Tax=Nocardioides perillae TaxID=1119534 RepID=A0A7Y9RWU2_9ACTN|nr:hypothetical protein [Nocardioides perillae]NYG56764.1 hypothetical protein [Nocardioides perillae]